MCKGIQGMIEEDRIVYLLLRMRSWEDSFETVKGQPFERLPFSIKGEGIGFMCLYATEQEAKEAAGDGDGIVPLRITRRVPL